MLCFLFLMSPHKIITMLFSLKLLVLAFTFIAFDETTAHKCQHQFICGEFTQFSHFSDFPFAVKDSSQSYCSNPYLQFSCEQKLTVAYLGSNSNKYNAVLRPNILQSYSIRLLDPGVQNNSCSSFPRYTFTGGSYDMRDPDMILFVSCEKPVRSPKYIDTAPCLTGNEFSGQKSSESIYSYVVIEKAGAMVAADIEETCTIHRSIRLQTKSQDLNNRKELISFQDLHDAMAEGYLLYGPTQETLVARSPDFEIKHIYHIFRDIGVVGIMLLLSFCMYKWGRNSSIYDIYSIEDFLRSRNNMVPVRYSYRQIKMMTDNFKDKLGEGGYGSVYKGKLQCGQFVAVKMLTTSKANGQDFINEVDTLGRIHHVNVVRLVGFCVSKSKKALIYDYMSNGSLDKFIFTRYPHDTKLNWSKIHEIAMGVARGVEYLHQGCDMQILHFDIKPHNILLDDNFVPKVSDFGLAKLHPTKNNVVTMTTVRGTLGYMAPELFYKRVGEISYKADIYSFGMLLMEMARRRRNLKINAEHSSQAYFPSWIYDQFKRGQDSQFDAHLSKDENGIARKMILTALWCIQMTPNDRPSMKEVMGMLQGDSETVILPPKPNFYPPDHPVSLEEINSLSSVEDEFIQSLCEYMSLDIQEL